MRKEDFQVGVKFRHKDWKKNSYATVVDVFEQGGVMYITAKHPHSELFETHRVQVRATERWEVYQPEEEPIFDVGQWVRRKEHEWNDIKVRVVKAVVQDSNKHWYVINEVFFEDKPSFISVIKQNDLEDWDEK